MKTASILFLFSVQISAFSITNRFIIDKLTATPELRVNIRKNQTLVDIDEFNIDKKFNESVDVNIKAGNDFVESKEYLNSPLVNQTELHTELIVSDEHTRTVAPKHQSREKRSFFGLILIPCEWTHFAFYFYNQHLSFVANHLTDMSFHV